MNTVPAGAVKVNVPFSSTVPQTEPPTILLVAELVNVRFEPLHIGFGVPLAETAVGTEPTVTDVTGLVSEPLVLQDPVPVQVITQ